MSFQRVERLFSKTANQWVFVLMDTEFKENVFSDFNRHGYQKVEFVLGEYIKREMDIIDNMIAYYLYVDKTDIRHMGFLNGKMVRINSLDHELTNDQKWIDKFRPEWEYGAKYYPAIRHKLEKIELLK